MFVVGGLFFLNLSYLEHSISLPFYFSHLSTFIFFFKTMWLKFSLKHFWLSNLVEGVSLTLGCHFLICYPLPTHMFCFEVWNFPDCACLVQPPFLGLFV